jgi:hypothetical protein
MGKRVRAAARAAQKLPVWAKGIAALPNWGNSAARGLKGVEQV